MAGTWRPAAAENNGLKSPEASLKEARWMHRRRHVGHAWGGYCS